MDRIPGGANPTKKFKSEIIINASILPVHPVQGHRSWSLFQLGKGPLWAGQQAITVLTSESDRHLHSSPAEKAGESHMGTGQHGNSARVRTRNLQPVRPQC